MNRVVVVLVALQMACDPGVGVIYRVSMQPAEADSIIPLSGAIADALAQRHDMGAGKKPCSVAYYFVDLAGSNEGTHFLGFCVTREGSGVEFQLNEFIARSWGPKGDSLRRELRDTLATQFGPRLNEVR